MTISPECLNCTQTCETAYDEAARQYRVPAFVAVFTDNTGSSEVFPVRNPIQSVLERLVVGSDARGCTLTPVQIQQRFYSALKEQFSAELDVQTPQGEQLTSQPMPGGFLAATLNYPRRPEAE